MAFWCLSDITDINSYQTVPSGGVGLEQWDDYGEETSYLATIILEERPNTGANLSFPRSAKNMINIDKPWLTCGKIYSIAPNLGIHSHSFKANHRSQDCSSNGSLCFALCWTILTPQVRLRTNGSFIVLPLVMGLHILGLNVTCALLPQ